MKWLKHLVANPFNVEPNEHDDPNKAAIVEQQPPATRKELWSYYLYYNGVSRQEERLWNNGYTVFSYMPTILQYLAYRGGFDPETQAPCDLQNALKPCHVRWLNAPRGIPVSSMLLYVQAIAFSIQFLLFTTFGSLADYGRWNRHILLGSTVIACASQILPIALVDDDGSHWGIMMAIYVVALISYGTTLVFYAAAFPALSDNLPVVRAARMNADITAEESSTIVEQWRNHVSAISTTFSNIGFLILTAVLSGVSFVSYQGDTLGNAPIYNFFSTVVCGGFWVLNAIPYFMLLPKGRRGPPLPHGANHLTVGWKSIIQAIREARKLRYLFMYIFSYFMFSDAVSTITQMSTIITGEITSFSPVQITLQSLITAITSILGCLFFLWLAEHYKIKTKTNLLIIVISTAFVPLWGCFGIGLSNFGIRSTTELWIFAAWSGFFTAPIWAWQQTMLAELTPRGKENLFFGLFGVVNKASSWIGPVVVGAISETTSNVWMGWPFVLALFVIATTIIFFIDVDGAKKDLEEYHAISEKDTSSTWTVIE
ncbi:autophagy-related protein 22-like protein [Dichotomocladium elegans]|nr:autophagy-related protein 22-like protein [Dichotomocladium elegans]